MTSQRIRPTLLDLPFSLRWRKELALCRRNGGWHLLGAESQQGKTMANLQCVEEHPAVRSSAGTTIVIAQAWAARARRPILRSIAECLGGRQLAQMSHRELVVPKIVCSVHCELIIVNNAHHMTWPQWEELLNFDDVCTGRYQWRPAIVFSGVFDSIDPLPGMSTSSALNSQVVKRMQSRKIIRGHDLDEVRRALTLLATKHPRLAGERFANHASHVFDLLTSPLVDPRRTGFVGSGDLCELTWRVAAARAAKPDAAMREIIDAAYQDYTRSMKRNAA